MKLSFVIFKVTILLLVILKGMQNLLLISSAYLLWLYRNLKLTITEMQDFWLVRNWWVFCIVVHTLCQQ